MSTTSGEAAPGRRARSGQALRRWLGVRPVRRGGMIAAPLLLAVSALFGGFDAVRGGPGVPAGAVGRPIETGPLRITVTGARLTAAELGPLRAVAPADRWLVIVATVEVTAQESQNQNTVASAVRLSGATGIVEQRPRLLAVDDVTEDPVLQPGLPMKVGFAWPQRSDAPVPQSVSILLRGSEYRLGAVSPELAWWALEDPVARLDDVPVVDRRSAS